ncbi:MAG: hypothetical protein IPG89_14260 [Bacteroidetes bacterium]|nr:hypothetical protein [Bacteroidota bacterium]
MQLKKLYFIFAIAIVFFSCRKEKTYWDADFVAPVASSSLNLSNLFPDTLLTTNANGSLKIEIESDLFSYTADSLLELPDTTIYNFITTLFPFPGSYFTYQPGQSFDMNPQNEITFDIANGVKLKEAIIRSGKLRLLIKNPLRQPANFRCSVTSATKNGIPLSIIIPMAPGTAANPFIKDTLVDVSDYKINFSGPAGNKTNTIFQALSLDILTTAVADTFKYNDSLKSYITFVDLVPEYGRGYFGTQVIQVGPDTTAFDIFNQISSGSLGLDSAEIKLTIINQFGVDLRSTINNLKSVNPSNGSVSLTGANIGTSFNVGRAIATGIPTSPVVETVKQLTYNQSNTNINSFIGNLPKQIVYDLNANLNPLGNISGFNDFVHYGTSLKARMNAYVPLRFSANNIVLRDTTEFNATALEEQLGNINEGFLLMRANNSYPFSLKITAVLLDENNNQLESLIAAPDNEIQAPLLDANNIVVASKETFLKIPFDKGKLESIVKAKKIAYYIEFNTANSPASITFYNHYKLDLLLTADFNYTLNK